MRRLLIALLCLVLASFASAAFAREQSDAPDIELLGFSPDGRYFAYEQYGFDLAAGAHYHATFIEMPEEE
jgi:predicted secreted protein